jgi:Putative adhesin
MTLTHAPRTLQMTPARWVALAIGVPVALMMIGWLGFSAVAGIGQASFPVSIPSIPVQHGQLSVNVGGGNVTVRPGQPGAARLVGTVRYSLIRPDISTTSDGVNLRCRLLVGNCGLDATLTIPPRTGLALSTGGGDQAVSGVQGGVTLSSGGGNVSVSSVSGVVTASTGGGDLTADDLAGTLTFNTYGGNINATTIASRNAGIHSYGGDATLTFTVVPANLTITSDGGNITLILPRNSTGYRVLATPDGGNVSEPRDIINSSTAPIQLNSGGGDITIAYPTS